MNWPRKVARSHILDVGSYLVRDLLQPLHVLKRSLSARQLPFVVESGSSKKDEIASLRVIRGSSGHCYAIRLMMVRFDEVARYNHEHDCNAD